MNIFQLISIFFGLFMIYVIRVKSKKYKLKKLETYFWYFIWLAFIVLSLFPNLLLGVTRTLHFARVFDLLVVIAFMFLTALVVFLYFNLKDLRIKLEKYVRKEALKNIKTNNF